MLRNVNHILENEAEPLLRKLFGTNIPLTDLIALVNLQMTKNPATVLGNFQKPLTMIMQEFQNKTLKQEKDRTVEDLKLLAKYFSNNITMQSAILGYQYLLWYFKLPCIDINGITSEEEGEKALLNKCFWKNKQIPCSKIFRKVSTDQGVCCAFNVQEADQIFLDSSYTRNVKSMHAEEQQRVFESSIPSDWYLQNSEPRSQAGSKMGLTVILDAHTNLITEYSISSDFQGFTAMVIPQGDFPLTNLNEFEVKPGHYNRVALSAIKITADDNIRKIMPKMRNCFFQDETETIKIHRNYSQANCILECSLRFAQKSVQNTNNVSICSPWFFPALDANHRMCDPWEKSEILEILQSNVPPEECNDCLPDCNHVMYHQTISTQKFRGCDEMNFGMSDFCNLDNGIRPQMWAKQVLDQLKGSGENTTLLEKEVESSARTNSHKLLESFLFSDISHTYDAYENDIAILNVYFSTPTVMQYTTKESKNWFEFISLVGGNGGLFIGFSLVTILELAWLMMRVGKLYLMP